MCCGFLFLENVFAFGKSAFVYVLYVFLLPAVPLSVLDCNFQRAVHKIHAHIPDSFIRLAVRELCRFCKPHDLLEAVALNLHICLCRLFPFPQRMENITVLELLVNIISDDERKVQPCRSVLSGTFFDVPDDYFIVALRNDVKIVVHIFIVC